MQHPIQPKLTPWAEKGRLPRSGWWRYFFAGLAVTYFAISAQGSPIDGTLYTTYTINTDHTQVHWIVCGSTKETNGCYDSGNIGPFGKVGALLEGPPSTDAATELSPARFMSSISRPEAAARDVDLDVYTKTDVISPTFDTTTVVYPRVLDCL